MEAESFRIGDMTLHPGRELRGPDGIVAVGGRALDLLSALARADGSLMTKDELFTSVWNGAIVEENALQAQISAARRALGGEAKRLVTVHGRGYRLEAEPVPAVARATAEEASIAVMPFDNFSGDGEHGYLADGLAEELITTLARIPGLKVPARVSSFSYRGKAADVRTIARELGVATVLEGSVRAGGERLRVTTQLIDAASGFHLWAQSFDRTLGDLLALQDDLAESIAAALRRELGPRLRETHSAEAMRLVLEARAVSRLLTREALREAIRLARAAIELDGQFAKAWESLAGSILMTGVVGHAGSEAFAEARRLAERTLTLDPTRGGARGIISGVEAACGRFTEAAEQFELAVALDPKNLASNGHAIFNLFLPAGLNRRARSLADRAIASAPARASGYAERGLCASLSGDLAGARRDLDLALAHGHPPARPGMEAIEAEFALAAGDFRGAALLHGSLAKRELGISGAGDAMTLVFSALAGEADRSAASRALADLLVETERHGTLWAHTGNAAIFIHWQARLGHLDAAYAVVEKVIDHWRENGRLMVGSLIPLWSVHMAPFRADPRFLKLVDDLDLMRFWKVNGPPDGYRVEGDRLAPL